MRTSRWLSTALAATWLAGSCGFVIAGETAVTFATKPSVTRIDNGATVSFALSAKGDVEVAVLGADGKVVRHLAAGVLGAENPPPAPLKPGLAQRLEWDGKDDYGEAAKGGPFSVRVRAGMGAKPEKIVGGDPYAFWTPDSGQGDHAQWRVTGLEAKSDGNVYLMGTITSFGLPAIRQYDARGHYRRTVFPIPAGKPLENVRGWGVNVRADGTYVPRLSVGWMSRLPAWTLMCGGADSGGLWCGSLVPTPASDTLCIVGPGNKQMTIGTDSTLREFAPSEFLGGEPVPKEGIGGALFSALAPDGKSLYVSGLSRGATGFWREGQVWKVDTTSRKTAPFFALSEQDMKDPAPIGRSTGCPYSALHGVAADAEGHVFVCDRQMKRIAVLDSAGKIVRQIPVDHPDAIAVRPKSKAIYVTTRIGNYNGNGQLQLLKFNDWSKDASPSATVPLREGIGKFKSHSFLAVAEDKGEILVWVAYVTLSARVYRDAGARLELVKDFHEGGPQRCLDLQHMTVDQKTGDAYIADSQGFLFRVRDWKAPKFESCMLDAKTRLSASEIAIDVRSRHLYATRHYRDPVRRWKMDGQFFTPAPGNGAGDNAVAPPVTCSWVFSGLWRRGMAAAPGGRGLATLGVVLLPGTRIDDYSGPLTYFSPDSKETPWNGLGFEKFGKPNAAGIRFDIHGNLYVGVGSGKTKNAPKGFENDRDFRDRTGRIYRYAPAGSGSGDLFPKEPEGPAKVYDVHYGPIVHPPMFGVDEYGRIYYPNAQLPQVAVIDNEGNRVLAFGEYGNRDSTGGLEGDLVPTKDIPMAMPSSVDAAGDHIYVSDRSSRRIMRLKKTFAAAETVGIQ